MHRRYLLSAAFALAVSQALRAQAGTSDGDNGNESDSGPESAPSEAPHITVTLQQMRTALAQRFPLRYPVPGIMNLDMQTPRLRLLPEQNRLGAEFDLQAAGPALERSHQGTLDVDFALRYESADRTLRAHTLRLRRLQFPTLQPGVVAMLNGYAPALAERSLLEVVLHRLQPKDLALADTLGLQPGGVRVSDTGLVITLVTKPL